MVSETTVDVMVNNDTLKFVSNNEEGKTRSIFFDSFNMQQFLCHQLNMMKKTYPTAVEEIKQYGQFVSGILILMNESKKTYSKVTVDAVYFDLLKKALRKTLANHGYKFEVLSTSPQYFRVLCPQMYVDTDNSFHVLCPSRNEFL